MIRQFIPTLDDVKTTLRVSRLVFTTPLYLILLVIVIPVFLLILLLPTDYQLLLDTVVFGDLSIGSRLSILYSILPLTGSSTYSIITDTLMYVVATTVSVNITLLIYHLREHGLEFQDTAGGTIGSILGFIGAGCASCGSALLTAVFSVLGISGALTVLPLGGGEFLIVAALVSVLSIIWMCKGLKGGTVRGCPI